MEEIVLNKNKFNNVKFIWLSFVLAAVIMLITYIIVGFYPFGNNTIMRVDLYHQYGPFHEELRSRILNGQSLYYSWEGGLGKEFISQLAYYTSSPISFLMLLFPQDKLPEAMAFFALIKVAFAASFFAFYLKKSFNKNDFSIVAFSLFYAFMAFVTSFYWNIMWLDAVAIFPIVALGIERLVKEDKHITYGVSLAIIIIVNFYIAFLVCVFASLYFLVVLFSEYSWKSDKKIIIKTMIKFGFMSAIGGGMAMFLIIPTAVALSHISASDSSFPTLKIYQNVYQLVTNHFMGARPVVLARNEDLPNVYTGILTILLIPMYFLNKLVKRKEKILFAVLIIFMLMCSSINTLDYLIHGMHFPANLPHRFTFMYSFFILIMAYKAFVNFDGVKFRNIFKAIVVYAIIIAVTEFIVTPINKDVERVLSNSDILINAVFIAIYVFILYVYRNSKKQNINLILAFMTCVVFAETLISSYNGINYVGSTDRQKYVQYLPSANEAIDYIKDNDDGFYRTEFRRFTTINDAAIYHYKGFSQFSSLAYGATSKLMENLGIASTSNSYRYYDPTPLIDAILNIKYVMNKDAELKSTDYEYLKNFGDIYLYKNNYALPLGFVVNNDITDWQLNYFDISPFDVQNDFAFKTTEDAKILFNSMAITSFDYENIEITNDYEEGIYKYKLTNSEDLSYIPSMYMTIPNYNKQRVFLYVDSGNSRRVKITTSSKSEDRELSAGRSLFDVGEVEEGDEIKVEFSLDRKGEYEKTYRKSGTVKVYAANFDPNAFKEVYNQLAKQPMDVYEHGDTFIKGNVNAEKDGILFTSIPYDKGWKVTIDGIDEDIIPIGEGLIGLNLKKGEHKIVFTYKPVGFLLGIVISTVSLLIFIIYTIHTKIKNNKV